jgi:hypothetical protein
MTIARMLAFSDSSFVRNASMLSNITSYMTFSFFLRVISFISFLTLSGSIQYSAGTSQFLKAAAAAAS